MMGEHYADQFDRHYRHAAQLLAGFSEVYETMDSLDPTLATEILIRVRDQLDLAVESGKNCIVGNPTEDNDNL